ncbi:MAG: SpoIIE family protein phosphatase [Acidobacteriia bacterium]|nr:SpoIIE family protein phosphatase [Terriglobia bacterium]
MNISTTMNPNRTKPKALIADDQTDVLEALRLLLKGEGFHTETVTSPAAVMTALQDQNFDILLMDLNYARDTTSGQEGLNLLSQIRELDATLPVVVMTAWGTIELAVEAMHQGVQDFVQKPWENERLMSILRTQVDLGRSRRKLLHLKTATKSLGEKIREVSELKPLMEIVSAHLQSALESESIVVFTRAPHEPAFTVASSVGFPEDDIGRLRFDLSSPIFELLEDLVRVEGQDFPSHEKSKLEEMKAALLVPVRMEGTLVAFLTVGCKRTGQRYDEQDSKFLSTIAGQVAAAVNHLRWQEQEREFKEAREIQQGLLPKEIPQIAGFEISGAWQPARAVGGDYYDVFKLSDTQIALCIADVVGKGMPAALLMSNVQAAVKAFASEFVSPKELCAKVNRVISGNIAPERFITSFYCVLYARSKKLVYTNAGHNAPMLVRRDGSLSRLTRGGAVLGVFRDGHYQEAEVELISGDRLILFTDGVTELTNPEGDEFGEDRLIELVRANLHLGADELQQKVMNAIVEFSGGEFQDDATMLVLAVE